MSDNSNEGELGRSKNSTTPADHLVHLLDLGWQPTSPLILKYVAEKGLNRELAQWQSLQKETTRQTQVKGGKGN